MRMIYKYNLGVEGDIVTITGKFKQFLDVKYQPGVGPVVWAEVDDNYSEVSRQIVALGTGWPIPEEMEYWDYLGSVIDSVGYVWHYYGSPFFNFPKNMAEGFMEMLLQSQGVQFCEA